MSQTGVKILCVAPGTAAAEAGLKAGDRLIKINGRHIEDSLDLQFYLDDEGSDIELLREGSTLSLSLDFNYHEQPGWDLEPLKLRSCNCRCIFCFVDQLPPGLRPALYLKDEDYRFSFLYGNYLTLVGCSSRDYRRIFELKLSPLYVSIHATDSQIRGRMLGIGNAPILPLLRKLIDQRIEIHGQIVLVPGWNDGDVLAQTLVDLKPLYPGLASLAVVPVGLTEHRQGLPELRLITEAEAQQSVKIVEKFQKIMLKRCGSRWVFASDELLLRARAGILKHEEYEDYPQIENGVGLVSWLCHHAEQAVGELPKRLSQLRHIIWVTGKSATPALRDLAQKLSDRVDGLDIEVLEVTNRLLGPSVTVAGLLGGGDINVALESYLVNNPTSDNIAVYLPPDCLNGDGLFLDDWRPADVEKRIGLPVYVFDWNWKSMISGGGKI